MNRLAAILPAVDVLVDVDATSKKRAFEQAGLLFENQHAIARATVTDNLFARERLGSTGLGHGVAIPHGRIKGLKNPLAAVLRVRQPIAFDAPDDEPVSLLIFLLVPEAATQRHLEILSEIAEMLSDRELRERLKRASPRRARCTGSSPPGSRSSRWHSDADAAAHRRRAPMKPTVISAEALFEEFRTTLHWEWIAGHAHPERHFDEAAVRDARSAADLVGYLNYIHPNRVQIVGRREVAYLNQANADVDRAAHLAHRHARAAGADLRRRPGAAGPAGRALRPRRHPALRHRGVGRPRDRRRAAATSRQHFAERTTRHGVFMDILGLGVLLTGESGLGKSELGLELISRGHGLVADDAVDLYRVSQTALEGRCPDLLMNLLEVRGIGLLDIKAIFGETAVRRKMRLKLIVHLVRQATHGPRLRAAALRAAQRGHPRGAGAKDRDRGRRRTQPRGAGRGGGAQHDPAAARHRHLRRVHRAPPQGDGQGRVGTASCAADPSLRSG